MKILTTFAVLVTAAATSVLSAEFPSGWKHVQAIRSDRTGLVQFSVPIESIDAAQPDLRDLRLYDDAGKEISFAASVPEAPRIGPLPRTTFKVALNGDSTIVTVTSSAARPLAAVSLDTPAPQFMRAVTIEGSADGRAWTTLSRGEPFFRQYGASRLQFPLEGGSWSQLRLSFDNRRSPPIAITGAALHALNAPQAKPSPTEPLGVTVVEREDAGQQTRLTLRLAGANAMIDGLTLNVSDPFFTRTATLVQRDFNENEVTEMVLARGTIFRVTADDSPLKENLTLKTAGVRPPRDVLLVIDDGDSPPLNITGITAQRRPIHLAFVAAQAGTYHLLSGNPQAAPPRYDLAALRGQIKPATIENIGAGTLALNPAWRAPEILPEVPLTGGTIDLAKWRYRKSIALAASGVQQLELDLDVLARVAKSFADLRVVRDGKQLPYLLERTPIERRFEPSARRVDDPKRPTASLWEFKLPQRDLPVSRLECTTTASLFQRNARLTEERRDGNEGVQRVTLGGVEWVRTPDQKGTRLVLALSQPPRTDKLRLEVENGDNPPLDLAAFAFVHPATRVLFKADAGPATFLYYGNDDASAARYDLSLIARQILRSEKSKAALGGEEVLKKAKWSESAEAATATGWAFWGVLGLVVIALLVVLAKLLPKPQPPAAP